MIDAGVTIKDLARELGIHPNTARRLFAQFPRRKYTSRLIRFPSNTLEKFLAAHPEYVPSTEIKTSRRLPSPTPTATATATGRGAPAPAVRKR